jgi:hypothetical protein
MTGQTTADGLVHRHTDPPVDFDPTMPSLAAWVESLPTFEGRRPRLTMDGYLNLLRHMLRGGQVPYYAEPYDLLIDAMLVVQQRVSDAERRRELAELSAAHDRPTVERLWSLVYAAHGRKTMRTEDVRAALEAGRG